MLLYLAPNIDMCILSNLLSAIAIFYNTKFHVTIYALQLFQLLTINE